LIPRSAASVDSSDDDSEADDSSDDDDELPSATKYGEWSLPFKCRHCPTRGHRKADCPERARCTPPRELFLDDDEDPFDFLDTSASDAESRAEACFVLGEQERRNEVAANVVKALLDSGSTCHLKQTSDGVENIKPCSKPIDSANKGRSMATSKGDWKFQADEGTPVSLSNTYIMEGFLSNIVSFPCLLEKGCTVQYVDKDCVVIALPGTDDTLTFNREEDGLFYMEMHPIKEDVEKVFNQAAAVSDDEDAAESKKVSVKEDSKTKAEGKEEVVNINQAHEILDHPGETVLREQAKAFNWKLTSVLLPCDGCSKAKATAKSTVKQAAEEKKATKPGERLFWDTSGPYKRTRGANRYHGLVVDEYTSRCWSFFSKAKDEFAEDLETLLDELKAKGFAVKYLRLDNAGEAKALEKICAVRNITIKYTAPNTPQYNHKVEREFPVIRNMAYASLMESGMSDSEQMIHWAHAIDDSTVLRNLQPRGEWASAYEPFGEKIPVKPKDLVKFGAQGYMTKRSKIKAKWTPKAKEVIRVGYAHNHPSDTYIVRKKSNNEYVTTRDVKWDTPRRFRKLAPEALKKAKAEAEALRQSVLQSPETENR